MPSAKVVRRRRAAVLGVAAAAFVLGARRPGPATSRRTPDAPAPAAGRRLRLAAPTAIARAVGGRAAHAARAGRQARRAALPGHDGAGRTSATCCAAGWASGAILFRDNITSPEQLRALTRQLRRAGGRRPRSSAPTRRAARSATSRWAPPGLRAGRRRCPGRDARAAARALRAARDQRDAGAGRGRAVGGRRGDGRPRVLERPGRGVGGGEGVGRGLARRRRGRHRQALPRPRRRDHEHRPRLGVDRAALPRAPTSRRSAPRSRPACR